jgi:hypothetical protein
LVANLLCDGHHGKAQIVLNPPPSAPDRLAAGHEAAHAEQEVSMTPTHSQPLATKRVRADWVRRGIFAAVVFGTTALLTPAVADKLIFSDLEDDGSVTELYQSADGHIWAIFISADGKTYTVYDPSNPNPDGDETGAGTHSSKPDVVGMIKSGEATYTVRLAPADSPELMAQLRSVLDGGGLGPHYNPGDDDNGRGPGSAPTHSMEVKKTDAEIHQEIVVANEIAGELATLGAAMGDGSEGGGESPTGFNKSGSPGGTGGDEGNYTEGQNKTVGKTEKDLLGAKPEVVNPPHQSNGGRSATGGGSVAGGAAGGAAHNAAGAHG